MPEVLVVGQADSSSKVVWAITLGQIEFAQMKQGAGLRIQQCDHKLRRAIEKLWLWAVLCFNHSSTDPLNNLNLFTLPLVIFYLFNEAELSVKNLRSFVNNCRVRQN